MDRETANEWFIFLFWVILVAVVSMLGGHIVGTENERQKYRIEAIDRGLGHYVIVDDTTGESEFQWIVSEQDTQRTGDLP